MSIMTESGHAEYDVYFERPAANRDWLHHANQSLSRLKDVKKTSYSLSGGPREREVNCQCNYRTKSKSSFLSLEAKPPQLALDSQETASMPDLSIPEIVKQFNERQSQKSKQMRRPHSSAIYSTKKTTRKHDNEKPSDCSYSAFITVKGQTVTPQARPPHGPLLITDVKKDDPVYRGLVYLDPQHFGQHETNRLEGLQRYSSAFCDDEDPRSSTPPAPRASPEPTCPRTNSPDSTEESFNDENENYSYDIINEFSQTRSVSSAGSRSLVFAIPTASNEVAGSDDEDTQSDFKPGRLSTDYVAKSEDLLDELSEKNQTEAAEISEMLLDMESAKEKVSGLRISPRDLELNCGSSEDKYASSGVITPSVQLASMQIDCPPVDEIRPESGLYETVWVEEPADSYVSSALPLRDSRVGSERYMSKHTCTNDSGRIRKQQSESSLVLQGKTVEFFNSGDLSARNRLRVIRRTLKPNDVGDEEHGKVEKRNVNEHKETSTCLDQVTTKPPLPKWNTAKSNKKCSSRQKHSVVKRSVQNQPATVSSLRKSNSEGNIDLCGLETHMSATSNLSKKSVTFSQDVLNQDDQVDSSSLASFELTTRDSIEAENTSEETLKSLWSPLSGVVIQNGLEMKKTELERREIPETTPFDKASKAGHSQRTNQSTRAKVLAKMKELPRDEDPCPCRTVTRPTAALLTVSRSGKSGHTETSSKDEKLLKNRSTRPSSAVIYRPPCSELTEPKSPRRKPRAMSATVQREGTGSERGQTRPRPSSAHVGKSSYKDSRRSRAAAKVLKEGYLFKERRPLQFPPGSRERQLKREEKSRLKEENTNSLTRPYWNKREDEVVASEECLEVFARLQEKGIDISMDTIKRGLMAPARTATDYEVPAIGSSSGLLSRPENWLTEEHARVQIWENVLKRSK